MISGYPNNAYSNPAYQAPSTQSVAQSAAAPASSSPTVQPSSETMTVANVLTSIWNGLVNVVKSIFHWIGGLFGGQSNTSSSTSSTTLTSPTSTGTTSASSGLTSQQAAIAQQYQLLPTASNLQAFMAEVQSYQNNGALGPGSTNTTAISDLQKALEKLGYNVSVTGQYDSTTQQAIIQFKENNGLHQSYEAANGTWAINEYADTQTLQLIMSKLQQQVTGQPAQTPSSQSVAPQSESPTTAPTSSQPSVNDAALAKQYNLLDTPANVDAFLSEIKGYASDGTLGPGSTNTTAITDLQKALERLGYNVPVTGQYDSATIQAVLAFKQANGIHQAYQAPDGTWAVNEYAGPTTIQAIMQKLQASMQPASTSASTSSSSPASAPTLSPSSASSQPAVNDDAIAKQYGLLDTQANVNAFIAEIKSYQAGNALGPGSTNTPAIRDLQTALSRLGYSVSVTGQYDSATSQAVMAFKRANGLHQTYEAADGNYAVNEYADSQTLALLMQKLQQLAASQPAVAAQVPVAPASAAPMAPASASVPVSQLTAQQQALVRQYNLYPTAANVNAFLAEIGRYATDGTLGPGSSQTSAIHDLQTALSRLGYPVQASGTYDQATMNAVIAFKKADGLHQSYRASDGNWAVNEYADRNTIMAVMQKLQAAAGKAG